MSQHTTVNYGQRQAKLSYATVEEALAKAQQMEDEKGCPFGVYLCSTCSLYHIGRLPDRKQNADWWWEQARLELGSRAQVALARQNVEGTAMRTKTGRLRAREIAVRNVCTAAAGLRRRESLEEWDWPLREKQRQKCPECKMPWCPGDLACWNCGLQPPD